LKGSLSSFKKYKGLCGEKMNRYLFDDDDGGELVTVNKNGAVELFNGHTEKIRQYAKGMKDNVNELKKLLVVAMRLDTNMDGGYWKK
jgi:hypothetical protein